MPNLKDKVIFITGASRGIGREFAVQFAKDGAKIVIASRTDTTNPVLEGTIYETAKAVENAGGAALPIKMDITDPASVDSAFKQTVEQFGKLDILINNASAIYLRPTAEVTVDQYDKMQNIILRGSFLCARAAIPLLKKAENPHILNIVPPINMDPKWFKDYMTYTMLKYAASIFTLGLADELKPFNIAVNGLWPRSTITTAAIKIYMPGAIKSSRLPQVITDAAYIILTSNSRELTKNLFLDETLLISHGVTDFTKYAVDPNMPVQLDLFIE